MPEKLPSTGPVDFTSFVKGEGDIAQSGEGDDRIVTDIYPDIVENNDDQGQAGTEFPIGGSFNAKCLTQYGDGVTGFEQPEQLKVSVITPKEKAVTRKGMAAMGEIFELGVDRSIFELKERDVVHFFVEVLHGSNSLDRAHNEGTVETTVPPEDFENFMWQA